MTEVTELPGMKIFRFTVAKFKDSAPKIQIEYAIMGVRLGRDTLTVEKAVELHQTLGRAIHGAQS